MDGHNSIMDFTVIIPTYNRAESLQRLLASIALLQGLRSLRLEVLVVNNGSTDGTAGIIQGEQEKALQYHLQVIEEAHRGKASALNQGLRNASGKVLMVLDDDVVAHPHLLVKHAECYKQTAFDAVQGKILPGRDPEGHPADMSRLSEYNIPLIDYGDEFREIRGLTGTNMSFKREIYEKVGLFDPRLGPGAAGFSEDTEYSRRIRAAGFKIGYSPEAVVYHELNPKRYGRSYNREVEYRKGVSRSLYRRDSILFRVLPNLAANCFRYGLYLILGKSQKVYKTEGRIMKSWGYLAGKIQNRTAE